MPNPSKKLLFLAKGLGTFEGVETKSGGGMQWIFAGSSNTLCFPCMHCLGRACVEVHWRGGVVKQKLHGDGRILLLQMQQCHRNASAKCILRAFAGARIASTFGFAAPCAAQLCMNMSKTAVKRMHVCAECGHASFAARVAGRANGQGVFS